MVGVKIRCNKYRDRVRLNTNQFSENSKASQKFLKSNDNCKSPRTFFGLGDD